MKKSEKGYIIVHIEGFADITEKAREMKGLLNMKRRILVISSANMDFVQRMARLPDAGETVVESASYSYVPGGKGLNSAVTFARLGGDAVMCTRVGRDDNGDRLCSFFSREGVDTRFVCRDKIQPTGLASVMVEEDGTNRIVVYPGAGHCLSPDDVEEAFMCYPDGVFLQFEIPEKTAVAASRFAREKGIPLFVDTGSVRSDFSMGELGCAEIISPNEAECLAITGISPDSVENCLRACIRIASSVDVKYIVLKLGHRGSFVYDGKYYHLIPAHKVDAVDTTAAGDVYTAALTYAYLQRGDILEAARFATIAAAVSVTRPGASSSVPTLRDVKLFAKSIKEASR